MRFIRNSIALTFLSGFLFSAQFVPLAAGSGQCVVSAGPTAMPIGNCERALAACLNRGGDVGTCWNAYWKCTG